MARPVVKRTLQTYSRNIAELKVLQAAIRLDMSLDEGRAAAALAALDRAVDALNALCESLKARRAA
jgi:hypothetical protein